MTLIPGSEDLDETRRRNASAVLRAKAARARV
jgi:hypothetical protein